LGYKFDADDLEPWQVECYSIIANRIAELEKIDSKSGKK